MEELMDIVNRGKTWLNTGQFFIPGHGTVPAVPKSKINEDTWKCVDLYDDLEIVPHGSASEAAEEVAEEVEVVVEEVAEEAVEEAVEDVVEEAEEEAEEASEEEAADLSSLKKAELVALAKEAGIEDAADFKKAELVELLSKDD
jgi:hypothetical protein